MTAMTATKTATRTRQRRKKARSDRLLELLHDCDTWNQAVSRLMEEEEQAGGTDESEDIRATSIQDEHRQRT